MKELVERIERDYFPSGNVWEEMFSKLEDLVSSSRKSTEKGSSSTPTNTLVTSISDNETESILGAVYTRWMKQCPVEATLGMAGWFLRNGKGGKCVEVLRCVRGKEEVEREVETRWRGVVREFEDQRGTKGKGRSDDEDEQDNPNDEDEEMSVMQ